VSDQLRQQFPAELAADSTRDKTPEGTIAALLAYLDGAEPSDDDVLLDMTHGSIRCRITRIRRAPIPLLSPREHEVARMVSLGYTNKAIAAVLEISLWTVSTHLRRIFMKLNVSSRAAMVAQLLAEPATPRIASTHADQAFDGYAVG
jgi:DNA-binding CsgD family transcriptional regulator